MHIGLGCARDVVVVVCIERLQVLPTEVMASSLGKRKTPTELRVWSLFLVPMFHCIPKTPVYADYASLDLPKNPWCGLLSTC